MNIGEVLQHVQRHLEYKNIVLSQSELDFHVIQSMLDLKALRLSLNSDDQKRLRFVAQEEQQQAEEGAAAGVHARREMFFATQEESDELDESRQFRP